MKESTLKIDPIKGSVEFIGKTGEMFMFCIDGVKLIDGKIYEQAGIVALLVASDYGSLNLSVCSYDFQGHQLFEFILPAGVSDCSFTSTNIGIPAVSYAGSVKEIVGGKANKVKKFGAKSDT